jgi:hydrogenase assembly chaperone HypC/HupF
MCIGYPGRVVALGASGAIVDTNGRRRHAATLLVPDIQVGDYVTVAAGAIVDRLDPADAAEIQRLLDAAVERHERDARERSA